MRIKELRRSAGRNGRVRIVFEDGSVLSVLPSVEAEFALFPGMELEDAEAETLRRAAGAASAKDRAVRIISATGVTQAELRRRLVQKGESEQDAAAAADWLRELKLLDDAEAARQIVARGVARGYGEGRIRQMLYEKRVPKQYWDEALRGMPPMDEALERFLAGRLRGSTDRKDLERAAQAAARRGFGWNEIKAALARVSDAESDWEEEP